MKEFDTIIDYIIDQSNKYDINNLQEENDIQFLLKKKKAVLDTGILSSVRELTNVLDITLYMQTVIKKFTNYYNDVAKIYDKGIKKHYDNGYNQTDDLIRIGKELQGKFSEQIKEIKYNQQYDEKAINFIKNHAMEQAKGYSDGKINQIRSAISDLMLQGKANKSNVRDAVQKIIDNNKSKAEDIARTELSRAYNYGTLARLNKYNEQNPTEHMMKYWHGFAYSKETCTYCRPRIGNIYELDDNTEVLPAHVRCRCVWLPFASGWDKPISRNLTNRSNMLNVAYSEDYIYDRINNRLGISYANYMSKESAIDYISGDRSSKVMDAIKNARENAIKDVKSSINIQNDTDGNQMSSKFNNQLSFWKDMVATAIVDNDKDTLNKSYDAIKYIMVLPWNGSQLSKWNDLLNYIKRNS